MAVAGKASCSRRCGKRSVGESPSRIGGGFSNCLYLMDSAKLPPVRLRLSCRNDHRFLALPLSVLPQTCGICLCLLLCLSHASAATWSPEIQVDVHDTWVDWSPVVVADSAGSAWVFWMGVDWSQGDFEILYSRWIGDGWNPEQRVHEDNVQKDAWPAACIGKDGIPWVVWERHRLGSVADFDVLVTRWNGDGWSEAETLFAEGGEGQTYNIACADTGLVWVVMSLYVKRNGTYDKDIFLRKYSDGRWWPLEHIDRPGAEDRYPDIALSESGVPWVAWGAGALLCTHLAESGWTEPLFFTEGGAPRVCFSGGEGPWIVFDRSDGTYCAFWDGENWWESGPIALPHSVGTEYDYRPRVTGLVEAGPIVVWPRGDRGDLWRGDVYLSQWTDCWWKGEQLVTAADTVLAGVDESADVAVGAGGRTWVVWERYSSPGGACDIWARYCDDVIDEGWVKEFRGRMDAGRAVLEWKCQGRVGFNLYRSDAGECAGALNEGERELLTSGSLLDQQSFIDSTAQLGRRYRYWLEVVSNRGTCEEAGPILVRLCEGAVSLGISGVKPNPSREGFLLGYYAGREGNVELEIVDVSGRMVRRVSGIGFDGEVFWDGTSETGKEARPGIYFVRLLVNGKSVGEKRKLVLLH